MNYLTFLRVCDIYQFSIVLVLSLDILIPWYEIMQLKNSIS